MISQADYFAIRTKLLQEQPYVLAIEQKYMYFLRDVVLTAATNIYYYNEISFSLQRRRGRRDDKHG